MSAMAMKKLFAKAQASLVLAAYLKLNLQIVFPNLSGSQFRIGRHKKSEKDIWLQLCMSFLERTDWNGGLIITDYSLVNLLIYVHE